MNEQNSLLDKFKDGDDPATNMPIFGIEHEAEGMFIHDPYLSSCGRFPETPSAYGLTDEEVELLTALNKLIETSAETAINAACLEVQTALGIPSGDVAGQFFSDDTHKIALANAIRSYIRTEFWMGGPAIIDALRTKKDSENDPPRPGSRTG